MREFQNTEKDTVRDIYEPDIKKELHNNDSEKKIKDIAYLFFKNLSESSNLNSDIKDQKIREQQIFLNDIDILDNNTSPVLVGEIKNSEYIYTNEDIKYLSEEDAGYVNGDVLDYENENQSVINRYKETGLHSGAIRWDEYAIKDSIEYKFVETGTILSRWGNENGFFMSDENVPYEALELPVVKESNNRTLYRVLKPFAVEASEIAKQPWSKECSAEKAIQYRTPVSINELVKKGYIELLK